VPATDSLLLRHTSPLWHKADMPVGFTDVRFRGKADIICIDWSAILGYAFDFYNLIIMAFLLTQIQKSLGMTLPQTGLIVSMTLAGW
jgi:hypothetical protein